MELVEKTHFPWLMSNVIDNETGRPLADGKITHIMEWWGRRIGLVRYLSRLGKAESNKTTPLNKFSIQKHTPRTRYKYYKGNLLLFLKPLIGPAFVQATSVTWRNNRFVNFVTKYSILKQL